MAWSDYEQLLWIGNFELQFTWGVQLVKFAYPGGYADPAINVGHPDGDWGMALKFSALPQAQAQFVDPGEEFGGLQSRADYIWRFYQRHKLGGDKPFIVKMTAPGSGPTVEQEFLMRFAEDNLSFNLIACALFTSGLQLTQARVRGVEWSDHLSGENPLEI